MCDDSLAYYSLLRGWTLERPIVFIALEDPFFLPLMELTVAALR